MFEKQLNFLKKELEKSGESYFYPDEVIQHLFAANLLLDKVDNYRNLFFMLVENKIVDKKDNHKVVYDFLYSPKLSEGTSFFETAAKNFYIYINEIIFKLSEKTKPAAIFEAEPKVAQPSFEEVKEKIKNYRDSSKVTTDTRMFDTGNRVRIVNCEKFHSYLEQAVGTIVSANKKEPSVYEYKVTFEESVPGVYFSESIQLLYEYEMEIITEKQFAFEIDKYIEPDGNLKRKLKLIRANEFDTKKPEFAYRDIVEVDGKEAMVKGVYLVNDILVLENKDGHVFIKSFKEVTKTDKHFDLGTEFVKIDESITPVEYAKKLAPARYDHSRYIHTNSIVGKEIGEELLDKRVRASNIYMLDNYYHIKFHKHMKNKRAETYDALEHVNFRICDDFNIKIAASKYFTRKEKSLIVTLNKTNERRDDRKKKLFWKGNVVFSYAIQEKANNVNFVCEIFEKLIAYSFIIKYASSGINNLMIFVDQEFENSLLE